VNVIDVLAEPQRRRILDVLRDGERPVGELATELRLAQPSVSKHLKTLRDAGLVAVRPDAQRRLYRLRLEPLRELDAWLEPYRRMWTDSLDAFERHLEAMPDENTPDDPGDMEER
jgi:DNA-binding transcriptional ArsR family regulator